MEVLVLADIHDMWAHLNKMLHLAKSMDGVIFLGDLMKFRKFTQESVDDMTRLKEECNWMVGVPGNGTLPKVREFFDDLGINLHGRGRIVEDLGFFGVGGVQETAKTIIGIRDFYRTNDTSSLSPNKRALETLSEFGIMHQNGQFVVEDWSDTDLTALDRYSSPFENSEEAIYKILSTGFQQIGDAHSKILISHVPPYESGLVPDLGIGVSTGSKSITKFIESNPLSLALSGHYHMHHEFTIGTATCVVMPAVANGFYGVLSVDTSSWEMRTEICKF